MLQSMTGFGEARLEEKDLSLLVEVRSLNNRFLKTTVRLPDALASAEPEVERIIREALSRGAVNFTVHMRQTAEGAACDVNFSALERYVSALDRVRTLHSGEQEGLGIDLGSLMLLPGVCQSQPLSEEEVAVLVEKVKVLAVQAIEGLQTMRRQEGGRLLVDLEEQCGRIREHLDTLAGMVEQVRRSYHGRLQSRVNELLSDANVQLDETTLVREVAVFAERCDINEEILRLGSHLEQFEYVCEQEEQAGRRLDFLTQEMLREANTIASKGNDATISQHVVEIKVAIDRLKEQIQNVE